MREGRPMTTPADEYREEAERLAHLPREDQLAVIAMYRQLADSPQATPACRANCKRRAAALGKLLCRLTRRKKELTLH
jgi:hypothetical protein